MHKILTTIGILLFSIGINAQSFRPLNHLNGLTMGCYSPKRHLFYTIIGEPGKPWVIHCLDDAYGKIVKSIPLESSADSPKISADERYVYFIGRFPLKIIRLDLERYTLETVLSLQGQNIGYLFDFGIAPNNSNKFVATWETEERVPGTGVFEGISKFSDGIQSKQGFYKLLVQNDSTYFGIGGQNSLIKCSVTKTQKVKIDTIRGLHAGDFGDLATMHGDTLYGGSGNVYDLSQSVPVFIRKLEDTGLYYTVYAARNGLNFWYSVQSEGPTYKVSKIRKQDGQIVASWEIPKPEPYYTSIFRIYVLKEDDFLVTTFPKNFLSRRCQAKTPAPGTTEGPEIQICLSVDSTITVHAKDEIPEYVWSNGATTSSIVVDQRADLYLQYGDETGCLTPPSGLIQVFLQPVDPQPWINSQTVPFTLDLCKNTNVKLSATEPYATNFQWSTGATTGVIEVSKAGEYRVRTIALSGCPSKWSFPAKVNILPDSIPAKPVIQSTKGSFQYCSGEVAELFLPPGYNYYLWQGQKTSSPTWKLYNSTQLNVRVGTDARCLSEWSDWVNVVFNPNPKQPVIQRIENLLATNNTGEYHEWYWNNQLISSENSQFLTISKNGEYIVRTTLKGCISAYSSSIVVQNLLPTAVSNPKLLELKVFPNPVTQTLFLSTAQQQFWGNRYTHQIINLDGKIIHSGALKKEIDVGTLPAGVYLLCIMDGPKTYAQTRFVKL